jgi:benzil reductase ((S)-benzoin forming)
MGVARNASGVDHPGYRGLNVDLSAPAAAEHVFREAAAAIEAAAERVERVVLVNNAAVVTPAGFFSESSPEDLVRAMTVNALAPAWLSQKFLRYFTDIPCVIVNITSGAATRAIAGWASYCSGKAAMRMASQVLVEEVKSYRRPAPCSVVLYEPGVMDTGMQEAIREIPAVEFPAASYFADLKSSGTLKDPGQPARDIRDLCEGPMVEGVMFEVSVRNQ